MRVVIVEGERAVWGGGKYMERRIVTNGNFVVRLIPNYSGRTCYRYMKSVAFLTPPKKEVMFLVRSVCLFVCLSVRRITRKLVNGF